MSITLVQMQDAVNVAAPDASNEVKGEMLAAMIQEIAAVKAAPAPKAKARKAKPAAGNGATIALAANWNGQMMQSGPATITAGQARWLKANTRKSDATIAKLSMVDASNLRAKLTGKA